jgi:hypothetical protein
MQSSSVTPACLERFVAISTLQAAMRDPVSEYDLANSLASHPASTLFPPKDKPPGTELTPAPKLLVQGALGSDVGAYAADAAGLMFVTSVVLLELSPLLVAVEALLFVEALDCVWDCFCVLLNVFVFAKLLLSVFVFDNVFLLLLLPELLTPLLEVDDPPFAVLDEFPPVALAPDVELLLAPDVELEALVALGGVVTAVGKASQMNVSPASTTT